MLEQAFQPFPRKDQLPSRSLLVMEHSLLGEGNFKKFRLKLPEDPWLGRLQPQPPRVKLGQNLHAQFQMILVQFAVNLLVIILLEILQHDHGPSVTAQVGQVTLWNEIRPVFGGHLRVEHLLVLERVERRTPRVLRPLLRKQFQN